MAEPLYSARRETYLTVVSTNSPVLCMRAYIGVFCAGTPAEATQINMTYESQMSRLLA